MHTKTIQKIQKAYIKTYEEDVKIYKDIENSQGQGAFFLENTGIMLSHTPDSGRRITMHLNPPLISSRPMLLARWLPVFAKKSPLPLGVFYIFIYFYIFFICFYICFLYFLYSFCVHFLHKIDR